MLPFDWFRAKAAEYRLQRELHEYQIRTLQEATPGRTMPADFKRDIQEWDQWAASAGKQVPVLSESQAQQVQLRAQHFYNHNPWARAVVSSFRKYIFGQGFRLVISDKDLSDRFAQWAREQQWSNRVRDMGTRIFRDGEVFVRRFKRGDTVTHRFIGTHLVHDPQPGPERVTYGIETDPKDVEKPLRYYVVREDARNELLDGRPIDATEILHIKINVDAEIKRGLTALLPVFWILPHLPEVMKNRIMLHRIRTALAVVKTIHGGPSVVQARKAAQQIDEGTDTTRIEQFKPGTVLWATQGVGLEFKSPNLDAADAYNDVRLFLLTICAGTDLAEFMVSADASNANYASTLIAEGPAVRAIQDWQTFFDVPLENEVYHILAGISRYQADELRARAIVDVQWPPIVHRDVEAETKALSLQRVDGAISMQTYRARLGYDQAEEIERLAAEAEEIETEREPEPEPETETA